MPKQSIFCVHLYTLYFSFVNIVVRVDSEQTKILCNKVLFCISGVMLRFIVKKECQALKVQMLPISH